MRFYGLSESRVKKVIRSPERIERGVALDTIALMQTAGTAKHPYEIWVMVKDDKSDPKVISAWRYPGRTKPGEPLPEDILREIKIEKNF